MSFVLSKLLWILAAPANFLALMLILGVLLQRFGGTRQQRWGWRLTVAVAFTLTGLLLCPVDRWLTAPLEQRFPIPALPARVDGILVLGGMVDPEVTRAWGLPKLNQEADRLTEFVYLAHRYPQARLVFSGGSGALSDSGNLSEAPVARDILNRLGLPPERVLFEGQSRNTYENVLFSHQMIRPQPGDTWLVINSAALMPRTIGIFRQAGWPVLPYPVAFRIGQDTALFFSLDLANTLFRLDAAIHEWIGLTAYWLMDRTSQWFPGP